jgi:hypothetical protein
VNIVEILRGMYENRKMRPVETNSKNGGGKTKENDGGGELN